MFSLPERLKMERDCTPDSIVGNDYVSPPTGLADSLLPRNLSFVNLKATKKVNFDSRTDRAAESIPTEI